ncbi:hypothetical protein [Streptomyces sp. CC228A]|uniref:hypothetical protein n=1 Tax=Streptomyces sp. CC228A TaxID=2898186 RepID=UPI001F1BB392|nr:hypothetical protein [Streptomyces sp. CC228A]
MPATKASTARAKPSPSEPILERYYNVKQATVRLGLATEAEDDTRGQKWLRDGFNRPHDGSKGTPFPGQYMAQQLMFSESDLAAIAAIARDETSIRSRRRMSTRRQRRKPTSLNAA